jgi:TolA-binding protein
MLTITVTAHLFLLLQSTLQKSKGTRRKKEQESKAEVLPKLTVDEKGDIVNQAVEALQDAIQQVRMLHRWRSKQQQPCRQLKRHLSVPTALKNAAANLSNCGTAAFVHELASGKKASRMHDSGGQSLS